MDFDMNDDILGYQQSGKHRVELISFDTFMIWNIDEGMKRPVATGIKGIEQAFQRCRQLNRGNMPRYEVHRDFQADTPMQESDKHYSIVDTWSGYYGDRRVYTLNQSTKPNAWRLLKSICKSLNKGWTTEEDLPELKDMLDKQDEMRETEDFTLDP
jgi:hypothetical protein